MPRGTNFNNTVRYLAPPSMEIYQTFGSLLGLLTFRRVEAFGVFTLGEDLQVRGWIFFKEKSDSDGLPLRQLIEDETEFL